MGRVDSKMRAVQWVPPSAPASARNSSTFSRSSGSAAPATPSSVSWGWHDLSVFIGGASDPVGRRGDPAARCDDRVAYRLRSHSVSRAFSSALLAVCLQFPSRLSSSSPDSRRRGHARRRSPKPDV